MTRDGASTGLTADGSHPVINETPLANSSALILRRINNNEAELERPFHSAYSATVESTRRYTRLECEDG